MDVSLTHGMAQPSQLLPSVKSLLKVDGLQSLIRFCSTETTLLYLFPVAHLIQNKGVDSTSVLTRSRGRKMSYLLTTLTKKKEIDTIIRDTIDKVLVLRFGRATDALCLQLDDILAKSSRDVSKFADVALVDIDSEDVQVYVKYFDITLIPSTVFFFNAHHMKMDSGTADHTKWVGAFHRKQDFIDVVEAIYRGAMKGKLIVNCPLPPERIPKYQLLYKDV
ncbi:hypothetical protein CUMW_049740 [Citrus unshiu]|nr:hypothetical protein CUMW_049740 [Citrus unshiu]